MKDKTNTTPPAAAATPLTRYQKLLQQEVLACEDPTCCCEPEPRWLRLQHDQADPSTPSEWECLTRAPNDEL